MNAPISPPLVPSPMTAEELLAMPDDGVERWLINGQLRERRETDVTKRNRWHGKVEAQIAQLLGAWLDQRPKPHSAIYSGEVGCRLRRNPDTSVGVDVIYVSAELAADDSGDTRLLNGVPILIVEILSPFTDIAEIDEKLDLYKQVGVPLVWVVDPHDRTVTVYRPDAEPQMFNVNDGLSGEPHLPGFQVPVAQIFGR